MDYKEAKKAVATAKTKENYMIIKFSYDNRLILPHKEALALVTALAHAEQLTDRYSSKPARIMPVDRDFFYSQLMSAEEYEHHKIAALLGMKPEDIKEMADKINYPEPGTET